MAYAELQELVGETFTQVDQDRETLTLTRADGTGFRFHHLQECCESVYLEDVVGDLGDLLGTPVVKAEETSNQEDDADWTFYHLATARGTVTLRWCGESSYYSTRVDLERF